MSKKTGLTNPMASLTIVKTEKLKVSSDLCELNISKQDTDAISDTIEQINKNRQTVNEPNSHLFQGQALLFTGDNPSGKMSTAAHIADKLNYHVCKVNLRHIVNKYIGETEKNLNVIFKTTSGLDIVLFFDEADALFGKRTKVKDASTKFASIEFSNLLKKMESYDGLLILSSKSASHIDHAFENQFQHIIHIPEGNSSDSKNRWRNLFSLLFNLFKKKTNVTVLEIDGSLLE